MHFPLPLSPYGNLIIHRYVFKQGRITIPPELVLQGAELLPPRPANIPAVSPQPSGAGTPANDKDTEVDATAAASNLIDVTPASLELASESDPRDDLPLGPPLETSLENWNWVFVERERLRGMKLAKHFAALDDVALVWSGAEGMALGEY